MLLLFLLLFGWTIYSSSTISTGVTVNRIYEFTISQKGTIVKFRYGHQSEYTYFVRLMLAMRVFATFELLARDSVPFVMTSIGKE